MIASNLTPYIFAEHLEKDILDMTTYMRFFPEYWLILYLYLREDSFWGSLQVH